MAGIIDPKDFSELAQMEKNIASLLSAVKSLSSQFKSFNQILEASKGTQKQTSENIKQYTTNVKELSAIEKEMLRIEKETAKVIAQKSASQTQQAKNLERLRQERNEENKQLREKVKLERANKVSTDTLNNSYKNIQKQLSANILRYKNLSAAQRNNKKIGGQLEKTIRKQQGALKSMDARMGTFTRNVGNYTSAFRGLLSAFGLVGGVFLFAKAITGAVKVMADFEESMSEVKAITRASDKELLKLEKDARRLGGTTSKTAKEVSQLQIEFAKLGFSTQEILNATEATLQLSIAAKVDLADAAQVAGSTVRAFGLSTVETQRVVDVMAESFASSALNMEKFSTAMAIVAPVAKNAGKSIEFTTAQLAKLVDNGLDASTAGTGLRNVYLELTKKGLTLEQGLRKIQQSTNKNATALELFGKRGATVGTILAESTKEVDKLTVAFDDAEGAAARMAATMEDNLKFDILAAKSAWEEFVLSLNDGEGSLTDALRAVTGLSKGLARLLTAASKGSEQFLIDERFEENQQQAQLRLKALLSALSVIEDEHVKLKELTRVQDAYNKSLNEYKQESSELEYIINNQSQAAKDLANSRIKDTDGVIARMKITREAGKEIQERVDKGKSGLVLMTYGLIPTTEIYVDLLQEEINKIKELNKEEDDLIKVRKKSGLQRLEPVSGGAVSSGGFNLEGAILKQKKMLQQGEIDYEQFTQNVTQIEIDNLNWRLGNVDWYTQERILLESQLADKQIELQDLILERERAAHEEKMRMVEERLAQTSDISNQILDITTQFNNIQAIQSENTFNEEIQRIEDKANYELERVGDNANAQKKIKDKLERDKLNAEKKFNEQQKRIKTNQAITDKAAALINAGINTAVAVTKVLANPILAGIVAGLGAVQIAAISATPIPKFRHGTDSPLQTDTMAVVGDGFVHEIIKTKEGGMFLTPDKPTTMLLPKGSEVIPNIEQEMPTQGNENINQLINEQRKLNTAIAKQPKVSHNFTRGGYKMVVDHANSLTLYLDKYLKN